MLGESALIVGEGTDNAGLAEVSGREPTPEEVAGFADDYNRFMARSRSRCCGRLPSDD